MHRSSPQLPQLAPSSLRIQARRAIRSSIVTGEIEAGTIYPISYFASQLGVSATPVREALLDLANAGLVEAIPNRGFQVPILSEHDLDEIFELRLLLEVPSVVRLANEGMPEDVAACRVIAELVRQHAERGEVKEFLQADRTFHLRLLQSLGNRRLVDAVMGLRDQTRLVGFRVVPNSEILVSAVEEHEQLLHAIEHRDAARAETMMRRHLEHTRGIWAGYTEPDGDKSERS